MTISLVREQPNLCSRPLIWVLTVTTSTHRSLAISAITSRDYPLIQGYVLWIALIYMAVNLVVDLSYNRLDPRLRKELQA